MKKICLYLTTLALLSVIVVGCSEEKLNLNSVVADPLIDENAFDRWLYTNFVQPYNVAIEYRFVCNDVPINYDLAPAELDKSVNLAQAMLFMTLQPYDTITGSKNFNWTTFPKFINYVGSAAYNNNGIRILGTAEDGIKVILYAVNEWTTRLDTVMHNHFYPMTQGGIRFFSTIHHELAHIMHQRKLYTPDFKDITKLNYTGDEWNGTWNTLSVARRNGFISRYASSSDREDFVETYTHFIMTTPEWWEEALESARVPNPAWTETSPNDVPRYLSTTGADAIIAKLDIVQKYMLSEWGIDMIALRAEITRRIGLLPSVNIKTFNEL